MAELKLWQPSTREPWALVDQLRAAGMEVPTVTPSGYTFLKARLVAHRCAVKACRECSESRRLGLRTLRITTEDERTGRALDAIGAATWRPSFELR